MKAELKYRCEGCDELHDDRDEAEECCRPDVAKVYVCPVCEKEFEELEEEEAEQCCVGPVTCLCGEVPTPEDIHDSKLIGSLIRCRACILKIDKRLIAA